MAEPAHLRMARTGGAQGLGFDMSEVPPEPEEKKVPEDPWADREDVKYEQKDDSAKEQYGVIRAASFDRLVLFYYYYYYYYCCCCCCCCYDCCYCL